MRFGAGEDVPENLQKVNDYFGSPIEEKDLDLEGCYVANRYI